MNRTLPAILAILAITVAAGCRSPQSADEEISATPNTLTPAEQRAGWRLLFDGRTTAGWRAYGKTDFPAQGWAVESGCLRKLAGVRGGDIITAEQFDDFELSWEWRIAPLANNGIKYLVTESRPAAPGHEYQMIDDTLHGGPGEARFRTASFYHVLAPRDDKPLNLPPQWNRSRIVVRGNHVEHWLNGMKVLEYDLGSDRLKAALAESKFNNTPGFGEKIKGHIMLTDHGDEAWFRSLKVRELPATR